MIAPIAAFITADERQSRGGGKVPRNVDGKLSALERAFQLARSGRISTVDDIKKQLKQEGYDVSSREYAGPSLRSQLRELIKAAALGAGRSR